MSKPVEAEKENHERWVISYADLVTLLLGFFIILWSTSQVDIEKFGEVSDSLARAFNVEVNEGAGGRSPIFEGGSGIIPDVDGIKVIDLDLDFIRQAIDRRAAEEGVDSDKIAVSRGEQRIIIRLADNLLFPSASAAIRPEALPLLDVVGSVVAELSNEIRVEGHTDNIPVGTSRYPTNWELSSARATAVLRYIVEEVGVSAERAFAAGYGEFRPEASNATPEGRALNRRADIVILYERDDIAPALKSPLFEIDPGE
ncbi:MAG: flagellar motor protein MotB [Dehalococcoidia bacterium]